MKANELRIGNYVNNVNTNDLICVDANNIKDAANYDLWVGEPIPLTGEWLLKLGFRMHTNSGSWFHTYTKDKFVIEDRFSGLLKNRSHKFEHEACRWENDIRYVHQLQNLYFALTGEELKIKEA